MSDQAGKAVTKRSKDSAVSRRKQIQVLAELLDLERERIASSKAQTEIAREALQVTDKNNQRRFEFNRERVKLEDAHRIRSWGSKTKMAWTGITVAVVVLAIILWAAFLGEEAQRQTAFILTGYLLSSGAFFGVGYFLGSRSQS